MALNCQRHIFNMQKEGGEETMHKEMQHNSKKESPNYVAANTDGYYV